MLRISLILASVVVVALSDTPLTAQYPGGYPPGGSPPGGYPGQYPGRNPQTGPGIPWPGRKKTSKKDPKGQEEQNLHTLTGVLRRIDANQIVITAQDTRTINCKRSDKTTFMSKGVELNPADLKPGDRLRIEASQDDEGYFYAVNVALDKEGTEKERAEASEPVRESTQASTNSDDERPILRRNPSSGEPAKKPVEAASSPATPPASETPQEPAALPRSPVSIESGEKTTSEEGPPKLQRGKPSARKRERTTAEIASSSPLPRPDVVPPPEAERTAPAPPETTADTPAVDPRVQKARLAVASYVQSLPNYVCREQISRFVTTGHVVDWRLVDTVTVDVVYEGHKEDYRNVQVNGKPVNKKLEELSGSWSTGEFGSMVADLFSPATNADFRYRHDSRDVAGKDAWVYDYLVDQENSHWHIQVPSQSVTPGYTGAVWIEKETGRVLRIEMQASRIPRDFPLDKVESTNDFEYIRIGDREFLLPVHAETLSCQRGTNVCSKNTIDFRNYHKYSGESTITFEGEKK